MCVLTATICNSDRQREGIQKDAGSAQYPDLEVPNLRQTIAHGVRYHPISPFLPHVVMCLKTNVNGGWMSTCSDPHGRTEYSPWWESVRSV